MGKRQEKIPEKKRSRSYILLIILVTAFLVHTKGIKNEFLYGWDDGEYLKEEAVRKFNVPEFFSDYYLGMYQPLPVLTLSVNYQMGDDNPRPYHATNVLLHLLNLAVVFYFTRKLSGGNLPVTIFVTALMAVHPMHTEAVAWIAARSTLLFSLFYLLGLLLYLKYLDNTRNRSWLLYSSGLFILSLFSKSMAVTFPVVLFLLDYFRGRKIEKGAIFEKLPLLALSVVFGLVTIDAASEFKHISGLAEDYNLVDRFFLLCYSISLYIGKAIVPIKLQAIYSYPMKSGDFLPWIYYVAPLFLALIVLAVIYSRRAKKELIFGFLFFLITISLVLPLLWSRLFIVGERYSYLTYFGLFFAFGYGIQGIAARYRRVSMPAVYLVLSLYAVFLVYTTSSRINDWKSTPELLTSTVLNTQSKATGADALFFRGNYWEIFREFQGARSDYNLALQLNPEHVLALNNRGIIKGIAGELDGALEDFNKAIELRPGYAEAWYNRGLVYLQKDMLDKACAEWRTAREKGFEQAGEMLGRHCRN